MSDLAEWVICIDRKDVCELAPFVNNVTWSALVAGGRLWVRGSSSIEEAELFFARFGNVNTYWLSDSQQLVRVGCLVPELRLPEGNWQPLATVVKVRMSAAKYSAAKVIQADLNLTRTELQKPLNLLACGLGVFTEWVESAPQCRMEPLVFAVDEQRMTIVKGDSLPQILGDWFHESGGIAVPAGFRFSPNLSHQIVGELCGITDEKLIIFRDGSRPAAFDPIEFVRVGRSAVRATNRRLEHHA